jgi:predicted acylesterase/phospholipase RssA
VPRLLFRKEWKWSLVNLLQRQYAGLFRVPVTNSEAAAYPAYREATIKDLRGRRPAVRFNCTSLNTGDPCYFDQAGFGWHKDGVIQPSMPALDLPIAYAVTASSAFPPLFPPVLLSHVTLSCDVKYFENEHRLTDGGVYDNLGIGALIAEYKKGKSDPAQPTLFGAIIISDAEGNFDSDFDTKYSFPVNRNVRASDLLMKRVSTLQLRDLERDLKGAAEEDISFVRVKIRESVRDLDDRTVLDPGVQRALINVRTDLDQFTPDEVTALIAHGYSKARETLLDNKLVGPITPQFAWDPLKNWNAVKLLTGKEFQRSRLRRWRLWSSGDLTSWVTGFYALFVCLVLATPTIYLGLQSAINARTTAAAQAAEEAAQAQAVSARTQAASARAARDAAQLQVLSAAIVQIQTWMASMNESCSGGPHGLPPLNWASRQSLANKAVDAFNQAKLALAAGQTANAVQQINLATGEMDSFVNSLRQSCSGGSAGVDPNGFSAVTSARTALKGSLDELKRSLGSST